MGLDTTHNCWHGPYRAFNRFRYSLGHQIEINLNDYNGYGTEDGKNLADIKHDLMPLFNHSDCDGSLSIDDQKRIVKGLNQVLENFNDEINSDLSFKDDIIQFRDGCLDAISKNEIIEFK